MARATANLQRAKDRELAAHRKALEVDGCDDKLCGNLSLLTRVGDQQHSNIGGDWW